MRNNFIKYRKGYKYQLNNVYVENIGFSTNKNIDTEYIELNIDGLLIIKKGYAWDGASGLTIDTKSFMRGSLEHDALYQLMRMNLLNYKIYRLLADKRLYKIIKQDGMFKFRAWYVYRIVRTFGKRFAKPKRPKIYKAP